MFTSSRKLTLTVAAFAFAAVSVAGLSAKWTNIFAFVTAEARSTEAKPVTVGTCDTAGPIEVESTSGTSAPTAYPTLMAAFAAINAGTHKGSINIEVCGNTNEGTVTAILNASGSGSSAYTDISIKPVGGSARTITGATTAGNPMIDLSGADNVTIDGLNSDGNSLTISNTTASATSGTSTIRFVGGATNNTITNSNLQGSVSSSVGTNGAIIFFSTDANTANGNDNNTISNNNIGPAGSNLPTKAILCNGSITTTAIGNSGLVLDNNNIFDYFGAAVPSAGVAVNGGCNTFSITNNRLYQTGTRTWTTGAEHNAILLNSSTASSGVQGMTVTGNTIGFGSNMQTGTYNLTGSTGIFRGIRFNGITGGAVSNINNNSIASVSLSGVTSSGTSTNSPFIGIIITNGVVATNNNTIGSQTAVGSMVFSTNTTSSTDIYGIDSVSPDNWTSNGNNIGGFSVTNAGASGTFVVYGMRANPGTSNIWTATGNKIGGTIANAIQLNATGAASQVIGMSVSNAQGLLTSNVINDLSTIVGTGTAANASVIGINVTATTPSHTLSQNQIKNLSNTNANGASVVTGIQFTGGSTNVVERNLITGLSVLTNSTAAEVNGIRVAGGITLYKNNVINIGSGVSNAIGNGSTTGGVNGINEPAGTDNFYHNSVFLNGAPTVGSGPSYAFNSSQTAAARAFRNNIFFNARSNSGATGKNYIVRVGGTTTNPAGLIIDNNIYFANGSGAVFGFYNSLDVADFAGWQAVVGQDANSISADPLFVSATDLHLTSASPARDNGAAGLGVTNDFDNKTRPGANSLFDIGADEFDGRATNDVSATTFIVPLNGGFVPVNTTVNPQATFTNTGTASQTNITVRFRILDSNMVEVYNQTATIPSLASLAAITITFPTTVALSASGIYTMFAKAELGTDTISANDQISGTFTVAGPVSGTQTVGAGGNYISLTNSGGLFDAINNLGASGNVTINITSDLSGETGNVALNENPATGILIRPAGSPRTITGSSANSIIRINGADNVTIDGSLMGGMATGVGGTASLRNLTIKNTKTTATAGGVIAVEQGPNSANNITIKNVIVSGQDPTQTKIGIHIGGNTIGSAPTTASNNNVVVDNCAFKRSFIGIFDDGVSAAAAATGNVISHNDLTATGAERIRRTGIFFFNQNGIQVTENAIGGIAADETVDAIGIVAGVQDVNVAATTSGGVYNAVISKNRIAGITSTNTNGLSAAGIALAGDALGSNVVSNNMVSGISAPSVSPDIVAGIFIAGVPASSTHLFYNSIANTGDRGSVANQIGSYGLAISGANPNIELQDNIFLNTQTSGGGVNAKSYSIGMNSSAFTNLASDYNDFFSSGANAGGFRIGTLGATGTDLADLSAWQGATNSDHDSVTADPTYLNVDSNLHITSTSFVVNRGTAVPSISDDIDGQPRGSQPDIGADETLPGTVQFSSATYTVAEAGPTVTLTVTRTSGADGAVSVNYATSNGSASGGVGCGGSADYVTTSGTINFAAGDAADKTIPVPICNDAIFEGNETFNTSLSNVVGGASLGTTNVATTTITDDETVPAIHFSSDTYSTVEALTRLSPDGGPGANITISISGLSQTNTSVHFSTNGGTATGGTSCSAGIDYISESGTATILAGQTSTSFFVPTCPDTVFEGDETVNLLLSSPLGATLGVPNFAVLTIVDNDANPPVFVTATAGTTGPSSYTTLKDAVDAINAGTHQGDIVVNVLKNTVEANAPIVLNGSGAGPSSYTSVLIRPGSDGVTVSGATPAGRGLIELNGADDVTIDGDNPGSMGIHRDLTLQNTATNTTAFTSVVRLALATSVITSTDDVAIKNLNIVGNAIGRNIAAAASTSGTENTTFGIFAGPGASTANNTTAPSAVTSVSTSIGAGATATNLLVDNNSITTAARGISINGSANTVFPNLQITNNRIGNPAAGSVDQIYSVGITAQGSGSGLILGNSIWVEGYVGASAATHGIDVGVNSPAGTFVVDSNKVSRVQNNNGETWSAYGINLGGGANHVVRNNFVSGVINSQTAGSGAFGSTFGAYGIRIGSGTGHKIFHNSVHLTGAIPGAINTNLTAAFLITSTSVVGVDARNNAFSNQISGGNPTGTRNVVVCLPSGGTSSMNLTLNNNGYFGGSDALGRLAQVGNTFSAGEYLTSDFDPTTITPANNFHAYTSTLSAAGTNDNSSFATLIPPPFTSNVDLHVASGTHTRLESGGAAAGVNLDIDADARNATTPDIGADEFTGLPPFAKDMAAVILVTPSNGSAIPVSQAFTPQAAFGNNGAATQSNVTVRFKIIDSAMTTIYNQTVLIPSLAPLQTFTAAFPSTSLPAGGSFTIVADAELSGDQDASNDVASGTVIGVPPLSGTINVGTGQAYTSLSNAGGIFQALNTAGITGDVTIDITSDLTGETGAIVLNQIAEIGTGGYTVTIKPSGAPRVISGTSAATSALITLNGADRIVIDGSTSGATDRSLTITNNQASTGVVIWMRSASATDGATNNTVKNCIINGAPGPNGTTVVGILTGSGATLGDDAEAPNSNNTIQNNWIYRVQNSLYLRGGTDPANFDQNWTVVGNELGSSIANDKNIFRGMLIGNSKNFTITGNTVHGIQSSPTTSSAMSGIQLALLLDTGIVARNMISDIKNVSANGTGAAGISIVATSIASNVTIANNFVSDVAGSGSATVNNNGFGMSFTGNGTGYNVDFNSIDLATNQGTAQASAAVFVDSSFATAGAIDLRNNIFANNETTGSRYGVYCLAAANVFSAIDYNDYFSPNVGFIGGATASGLGDWQSATGRDANSKALNPLFVSSSDLHLQPASPVRSLGLTITGITTDIDGDTRDATPDIGADENLSAVPASLQFSSSNYQASENVGSVTITVTRTGAVEGTVGVSYATSNGTATGGPSCASGIDYVTTSGTLTFASGEISKTFSVTICNDSVAEPDEFILYALSTPTGGAVLGSPSNATQRITDDDPSPGTITVNDVRVVEGNSGTSNAVFSVTYTGTSSPSSVNFATANGTATAGVDYMPTSGTLNFTSTSQTLTVSVPIIGDTNKEENETLFLNLNSPINAMISDPQGVGIIVDDDRAFVSDFDHDLKSDLSVYRPSEGNWYVLQSENATPKIVPLGNADDRPVPGDYDGDGHVDYAVWRPSTGTWLIQGSLNNSMTTINWGLPGDKPVQGDYDGDGKTDIAVYRPSNGTWWFILSSNGNQPAVQFGIDTDLPVPADYDGDAKTDIAVYRSGAWYIARSRDGQFEFANFGTATDKPVTGDFDGDGTCDIAVYRNGDWWIANSLTGIVTSLHWGLSDDIPVPADYDGDGTTDIAVFRPSNGDWFVLESRTNTFFEVHWGSSGDIPTPAAYLPQ